MHIPSLLVCLLFIVYLFQFRYTQIALSQDRNDELMSHHDTYPSKEAFFIECHNPKRALKFRVSVVCENSELVNMLVTPYTPPKG